MPFKPQIFLAQVSPFVDGSVKEQFNQACRQYATLTNQKYKAECIHGMMELLEMNVEAEERFRIMEGCGRVCIGASRIAKAVKLQRETNNLDDVLSGLNAAHMVGGHLVREGAVIWASYDRCYCGSVSKTQKPFSETYCHCSCGWYQQLFETLFHQPVKVDLLDSIIQGGDSCQFQIHIPELAITEKPTW